MRSWTWSTWLGARTARTGIRFLTDCSDTAAGNIGMMTDSIDLKLRQIMMTIAVMGRDEMKHVEMIIDYIVDGEDFQYSDNHGVLIRCKDCKFWDKFPTSTAAPDYHHCGFGINVNWYTRAEEYCSRGERRDG
jgi:hypothetical protein